MNTIPSTNTNPAKAGKSNQVGSAILALSSMLSTTFGRKASGQAISCQIALEKAGIIRLIGDRVESGLSLTEAGYKTYKALSKIEGPEQAGAAKVIQIAKTLRDRGIEIKAYKAAQLTV